MDVLPPLVTPAGTMRLPICDRTARSLLAALVSRGPEAGPAGTWAPLLERDAALALWCACRAAAGGRADLTTADDLAAWLTRSLVDALAEDADAAGENSPDLPQTAGNPQRADSWADLAAHSFSVARLAGLVARHQAMDPAEAQLIGLLHASGAWLLLARSPALEPGPSRVGQRAAAHPARRPRRGRGGAARRIAIGPLVTDELIATVPAWLAAALAEVAADRSTIERPADCVAAALRLLAGPGGKRNAPEGFQFDRRQHAAEVDAVRDEWLGSPATAHGLPNVLSGAARLAARLHSLEQEFQRALEAAKLESLKELAYGAGHEINNPLANISARAQTLLVDETDLERRRLLAAINAQAFRAHEMIADMMLFARPPQPQTAETDLVALARGVVEELQARAAAQRTSLDFHAAGYVVGARVDKTQIAVALRALCVNALEALGSGGQVRVGVDAPALPMEGRMPAPAKSPAPHETVQITVTDSGPGIAADVRPHIFDPFFSGREAGRGLGFGLAKCWRIVRMHGGRVDVESTPGTGATFTIRMPAAPAG